MKLYPYQQELVSKLALSVSRGETPIIGQLPTGGGKTVVFSSIVKRFLNKSPDAKVLILVHGKELRKQAVNSLRKFYGIDAFEIKPSTKWIPKKQVYCGLIQTVKNRLALLPEIDMLIIDECHLGHFRKVFDKINGDPFIIGFSATPVGASKKYPLNTYYKDVVEGPQIKELIAFGSLTQNMTYAPAIDIDRNKFRKSSNGDFRESDMVEQFSKSKSIITTRIAYEKFSLGQKTIIFNVNIDHSLKVTEEFKNHGYNVRHVDGKTKKNERDEIFEWFKNTPDAILCNVGIATMGFDEPTIKTVIVNRSTASLPLWLQMCGRGSRIHNDKEYFTIIDLGMNALNLGDWNQYQNWKYKFDNPNKPTEGVAPVKSCPNCDAIIHSRVMKCTYCGHVMENSKEEEKEILVEDFKLITKSIVVQKEINVVDSLGWNEWSAFFRILNYFANNYNPKIHDVIIEEVHNKIRAWHNHYNRKYTENRKEFTEKRFEEALEKQSKLLKI